MTKSSFYFLTVTNGPPEGPALREGPPRTQPRCFAHKCIANKEIAQYPAKISIACRIAKEWMLRPPFGKTISTSSTGLYVPVTQNASVSGLFITD